MEFVQHPGERKIQRSQTEDGKDVRRINDEGIFRDGEECRDGVHRKNHVGDFDEQEHDEEWRRQPDAVFADEELIAAVVARDWDELLEPAHHRVALGMKLLFLLHDHLDAGHDQERAEDINDPLKLRDEHRPGDDHGGSEDERTEDAPKEHAVLIGRRHGEVGEQHRKNENVIYTQRVFDDVAGGEFQSRPRPSEIPNADVEEHGESDPRDRPAARFAKRNDMRLPVEDAEVEREHAEDENVEADPEPGVVCH